MSDDDEELKIETQKDIQIGEVETAVGIVNGERGTSNETFPAIPIPQAAPSPEVPAAAQAVTLADTDLKVPTQPTAFNLEISAPLPHTLPPPSEEPPEPAIVFEEVPAPTGQDTQPADFNIFSEKTQLHVPSSTESINRPQASKVATFDDKTVVQVSRGSIAARLNISKPQAPPPARERNVAEPPRATRASHDISYQSTDNDIDSEESSRGFRISFNWLEKIPKIDIDRKKISVVLGAIAVLMVLFHFFFAGHDTPPPVTETESTAPESPAQKIKPQRDLTSKTPPAPAAPAVAVPIIVQPQLAPAHQTSAEFFVRFHAAMQKNQN